MNDTTCAQEVMKKLPLKYQQSLNNKIILFGIVILFCGVAIGTGITMLFLQTGQRFGMMTMIVERPVNEITGIYQKRYNLTKEQTENLEKILRKHLLSLYVIHQDTQKKIESLHNVVREELGHVFTPEQLKQWNDTMSQNSLHLRKMWKEEGEPGGHKKPGGPPDRHHPDDHHPERHPPDGFPPDGFPPDKHPSKGPPPDHMPLFGPPPINFSLEFIFSFFDKNLDGNITKDEVQKIFDADTDGNGIITEKELRDHLKKIKDS